MQIKQLPQVSIYYQSALRLQNIFSRGGCHNLPASSITCFQIFLYEILLFHIRNPGVSPLTDVIVYNVITALILMVHYGNVFL